MSKITKGDYGYIRNQRKKLLIITLIMFAIPLIIFFTGIYMHHTRKNFFTVVAILGCLPASKFAVNLIMIWLQKPLDSGLHQEIASHVKDMTVIYEAPVSAYEKNTPFECIVISGLNVVGLSISEKTDAPFAEKHIKKILQGNGFRANVKIFKDKKSFLRRVDELYPDHLAHENEVPFTPDERYPDASRNELVRAVILAISL